MKALTAIFAAGALGVSLAAQADDTQDFNPVRDRLEERGVLETLKQDTVLAGLCGNLQELHTNSGDKLITASNEQVMWAVYLCNALGHSDFETVVYNTEILSNPSDYGTTEEGFKVTAGFVTESSIQKDCQNIKQLTETHGLPNEQAKELYSAYMPVCAAYDAPLPEAP